MQHAEHMAFRRQINLIRQPSLFCIMQAKYAGAALLNKLSGFEIFSVNNKIQQGLPLIVFKVSAYDVWIILFTKGQHRFRFMSQSIFSSSAHNRHWDAASKSNERRIFYSLFVFSTVK